MTDAQGRTFHYAKAPQARSPSSASSIRSPAGSMTVRSTISPARLPGAGRGQLGDGQAWTLVGLLSLQDPPRPDAKATIAETQQLGLAVKMVTGDDVAIGLEIAKQLDGRPSAGGRRRVQDGTDPDHIPLAAAQAVERADRFGRCSCTSEIAAKRQLGHLVAMTGDGVNDAPASAGRLRVAVSGATDAARSTRR